jgi:predicted RNA-binding protein YlxR (DUF448 family)
MGKRHQRRKHVPQRTCIACRAARPKRELVRVVRTPEGTVLIDESGKRSGRGAYLCRQQVCWESALSQRKLDRALKVAVPAETIDRLREYASELPKQLPTESGEEKEPDKGVSV